MDKKQHKPKEEKFDKKHCDGGFTTQDDPNDNPEPIEPDPQGNCPTGYYKGEDGKCYKDPGKK